MGAAASVSPRDSDAVLEKWLEEEVQQRSSDTNQEQAAAELYKRIIDHAGGEAALAEARQISEWANSHLVSRHKDLLEEQEAIWSNLPPGVADRLRSINEEIQGTYVRQDPIYSCMSFEQMQKASEPVMHKFNEILDLVLQKIDSRNILALKKTALKGPKRGKLKVAVDYAGDCSMLTDMVRGTLQVQGRIADLYEVLSAILELPAMKTAMVKVEVLKDRFQKSLPGGYCDISLLLRVRGMLCELQLNLKPITIVKESEIGHGNYEKSRLVNDDLNASSMAGNLEGLKKALINGANPNVADGRFGITALNFPAAVGNVEMVKILLDAGADACLVDSAGTLPILRAARSGFRDIVQLLLSSMKLGTVHAANRSRKAEVRFVELVAFALDQGWLPEAADLCSWWRRAEQQNETQVHNATLLRWLIELGLPGTIEKAMQLGTDFWVTEDVGVLVLAAEKLPESVEFLRHGFHVDAFVMHEQINRLISVCKTPSIDNPNISFDEFQLLHDAIGQVIAPPGEASCESLGFFCMTDSFAEFRKASGDNVDEGVTKSRLVTWLSCLCNAMDRAATYASTLHNSETNTVNQFMDFVQTIALRCRSIRESDRFIRFMSLPKISADYADAYRNLSHTDLFEPIFSEEPPGPLMQPLARDRGPTVYADLVAQATKVARKVENIGQELRRHIGAPIWRMGSLKAKPRSLEKIRDDYPSDDYPSGEARRLVDVLRFSVVCENMMDVKSAIEFMKQRSDVKVLRVKSGFDPKPYQQCGDYRDVKLNCAHMDNGHIFEVQLHLLVLYSLRQERGYDSYKWFQELDRSGYVIASDVLEDIGTEMLVDMSVVVRRKIETVSQDCGDDSIDTMHWRMALVMIARITKNREDLQASKVLLAMANTNAIRFATTYNIAEIQYLCARSTIFSMEDSIDLVSKARTLMHGTEKADRSVMENLFSAQCLYALGQIYYVMGKTKRESPEGQINLAKSIENLQLALAEFREAGLEDRHPVIVGLYQNLGGCMFDMGRIEECIQVLQKVMATVGDEHPRTATLCSKLGLAYKANKEYRQALACIERSLAVRIKNVGDQHPMIFKEYVSLGKCRLESGDKVGALFDFEKALTLGKGLTESGKNVREIQKDLEEIHEKIPSLQAEVSTTPTTQ